MSIYRRGSVWWAHLVVKGKPRVRVSLETTDRLEAEEKEKALRLKLVNGSAKRDQNAPAPTLKEAFERFESRYEGESKRVVRSHVQSILPVLGHETPLNDIDESTISSMIDQFKREGNSGSTINRKTSTLGQLLKVACYEWRVIHRVPYIKRFRESKGRIRVISYQEENQLRQLFIEYGEPKVADLVTLLVDTGCRLGEAINLKCEDVNFGQKVVYIWKPKNKTPRVVPLTNRVLNILRNNCKPESTNHRPFGDLKTQHLTYIWRRVRKALGMENDAEFTIHALRHTTATRLINAGVPIYTVQHFLGHSTVKVTERYAHLNGEPLREAAEILEAKTTPHSVIAMKSPLEDQPMRDSAFNSPDNPWQPPDPTKKPIK